MEAKYGSSKNRQQEVALRIVTQNKRLENYEPTVEKDGSQDIREVG
jgi:hypothetical protein